VGALRERGASNSVAALVISALMGEIQVTAPRKNMKTRDRVLRNPQRLLLSTHPAVIKIAGMFMTRSDLEIPRVSLGVLVTQ